MTESNGETPEYNETLAESLIKRVFHTATRGKQDIVEIHIHEERKSGIYDVTYHEVPLDRPPTGSRLKLEITIRDNDSGRTATAIANTSIKGKTLTHPAKVETVDLGTLPTDTTRKKVVKSEIVRKMLELIKSAVEAVVSAYNLLVSIGVIKPH